jgi:GT2 family glycosyltransferase
MRISVVVCSWNSEATLEACLAALERQSHPDYEVLLVDSSPNEACARIAAGFPRVRLIRSAQRLWMHEARNRGVTGARGEILAFTDPDCLPDPDWLIRIEAHMAAGHRVVGGAMVCEAHDGDAWAEHLVKFWRWLPGSPEGPRDDVPTANMALDRGLFDEIGAFSERYISADTLICWQLRSRGYPVWFDGALRVVHIGREDPVGLIRQRFRRGADFFSMRASRPGWTRGRSALFLAALPILPLRHLVWQGAAAIRAGLLSQFLLVLPTIAASDVGWMCGQASAARDHLFGRPMPEIPHPASAV